MERSIQILKFGGTSVGSGERIRRVAAIIAHHLHNTEEAFPVVVAAHRTLCLQRRTGVVPARTGRAQA